MNEAGLDLDDDDNLFDVSDTAEDLEDDFD